MATKLDKTTVGYRPGTSDHRCGNCSMFREPAQCTLVQGFIRPEDVCNRWAAKEEK